jgi:hypothetical protein
LLHLRFWRGCCLCGRVARFSPGLRGVISSVSPTNVARKRSVISATADEGTVQVVRASAQNRKESVRPATACRERRERGVKAIWNGVRTIATAMRSQGARLASVTKKQSESPSSESGNGSEKRALSNRYFPVDRRGEREGYSPYFRRTLSNRCFYSARRPSSERENGLERFENCASIKWRSAIFET